MTDIIVEHKVKDFDAWLPVFRAHDETRRRFGCEGASVRRDATDPNDVVIEMRWSSPQRFREFVEKSDLRQVMERSGVVSEPRINVLSEPVAWQK